jgi:hypothetical protein
MILSKRARATHQLDVSQHEVDKENMVPEHELSALDSSTGKLTTVKNQTTSQRLSVRKKKPLSVRKSNPLSTRTASSMNIPPFKKLARDGGDVSNRSARVRASTEDKEAKPKAFTNSTGRSITSKREGLFRFRGSVLGGGARRAVLTAGAGGDSTDDSDGDDTAQESDTSGPVNGRSMSMKRSFSKTSDSIVNMSLSSLSSLNSSRDGFRVGRGLNKSINTSTGARSGSRIGGTPHQQEVKRPKLDISEHAVASPLPFPLSSSNSSNSFPSSSSSTSSFTSAPASSSSSSATAVAAAAPAESLNHSISSTRGFTNHTHNASFVTKSSSFKAQASFYATPSAADSNSSGGSPASDALGSHDQASAPAPAASSASSDVVASASVSAAKAVPAKHIDVVVAAMMAPPVSRARLQQQQQQQHQEKQQQRQRESTQQQQQPQRKQVSRAKSASSSSSRSSSSRKRQAGGEAPPPQSFSVNGRAYLCLQELGRGGSSTVYKVFSKDKNICALKIIDLTKIGAGGHLADFRNEIELLKRVRGQRHAIRLMDYEEVPRSKIKMLFELGEFDLGQLFRRAKQLNEPLSNTKIRYYWEEILRCVQVCHEHNIVHSDLKPANFVSVRGELKIIDFGIAKASDAGRKEEDTDDMKTKSIFRDEMVGTINYMSPESLDNVQGPFKLGPASDVWSLGCILYQMLYKMPPFKHIKITQADKKRRMSEQQCRRIAILMSNDPKSDNPINFEWPEGRPRDRMLVHVLKRCLSYEAKDRPTIDDLLHISQHPDEHQAMR